MSSSLRACQRRLLAAATALCIAGLTVIASAPPASAHCPGGSTSKYVAGGASVNAKSVQTTLEYLGSPNVCGSGTSYSISIVHGTSGTAGYGWLQVGWRYYSGYAAPMGYCERRPNSSGNGTYALSEYSIPASTQVYSLVKNDTQQFDCSIAGVLRRTTHQNYLGFTSGDWVPVQAEAHTTHAQLGRYAPNWFDFSNVQRILAGSTNWYPMGVNNVHSDDVVWGWAQPNSNGFKVNTSASH